MKVVVVVVKFIRSHGLTHCQFQSFLSEIDDEYGDVVYRAEVQWLRRETVLKSYLALRLRIRMFMNKTTKSVFVWDLALLYISHHFIIIIIISTEVRSNFEDET